MHNTVMPSAIGNWIFWAILIAIGVLNIVLVHPVPGIFYIVFSLLYFPPANAVLKKKFGMSVPLIVKFVLGFVAIWFTLGISDLAEILGL